MPAPVTVLDRSSFAADVHAPDPSEAAVLAGVPAHRHSVFDDAERKANACMMVWVSRSCSARPGLDL